MIMAWNMTEPRNMMCSICRNHNPVLSSLMTYHCICNNSIMIGLHMLTLPGELQLTSGF
jgi:hypothetical protein